MEIRELMTRNPKACLPTESCAAAGWVMVRQNCGFVPIVDSHVAGRLVGVITDRDIALHLVKMNLPADQVVLADCMTHPVKFVAPTTTLDAAIELMEKAAIHRLPVVEDERLVGVVSLKDIALAARKEGRIYEPHKMDESQKVERQIAEVVEAISTAR